MRCGSSDITVYIDVVCRHTGQKIISNQHAEEHKIVDDTLHIVGKWKGIISEFQLQIFPQKANLEQNEALLTGILQNLSGGAAPAAPRKADYFSQQTEMRLMGHLRGCKTAVVRYGQASNQHRQ